MRSFLFLLALICSISTLKAQSFNKDTLYLRHDTLKVEEWSTDWFLVGTKENKVCGYKYYPLPDGSPLQFHCEDRSLSQVISQNTLNNYPVRTLEQLKVYINTLTYEQALKYLEKMKRYYIVEILPNGTAEIIPVKLDMQID
jgi:hypothetical protein